MPDIPPYDEAALALQVAEGSEKAFAELYRLYVPQLVPFVYSITKSDVMVDEMIQEAFLRLWMNRDKLTGVRNPKAWVFKITANICYTYLRRSMLERKVKGNVEMQGIAEDAGTKEHLDLRVLTTIIAEAVSQLSPQRKKIYQMSREEGMTLPEICSELGLSMSTVKNTLTTALQFIREQLSKQGYTISFFYLLVSVLKNN